jgi:hypothetical protein
MNSGKGRPQEPMWSLDTHPGASHSPEQARSYGAVPSCVSDDHNKLSPLVACSSPNAMLAVPLTAAVHM